ncbi:hypothetical protein JKF63_04401 [Porcisia hertigi]|uniref:C3H1-type domain-containing protein n=1 Tax=Porcisia hertigi TaxID=2761500 RepID=A0A836I8R0_9TRYP|nr:hypothetical protein JKF63_04401 [Porcisia hertigi]
MSWWNGFSTHRNNCVVEDGLSQQQQQQQEREEPPPPPQKASGFLTPEPPMDSAVDDCANGPCDARSPKGCLYLAKEGLGSAGGLASPESTWGGAVTNRVDGSSFWQTSNSLGGLTMSDQLGVSAAVSVWGSTFMQQQPQQPLAPNAQQPLSVPSAARPVQCVQISSTKGDQRCGSGAYNGSGSSDAHNNGGSVEMPTCAADYGEPSPCEPCGVVVMNRNSNAVATHSRSGSVTGSRRQSNTGKHSVVCSDDEGIPYDEVDVGTISSLIAALQVQEEINLNEGNAADSGRDEPQNADSPNYVQRPSITHPLCVQADAGGGVDATAKSAAAQPPPPPPLQEQQAVEFTSRVPNPSPILQDPNAGSSLIADFNTLQNSGQRSCINTHRSNASGSTISGNTSGSRSSSWVCNVSLREASSGDFSGSNEQWRSGANPLHSRGELAPLQLVPSALQNVLASFQSALVERSSDATLPSSVGDLFNAVGQNTCLQKGGGGTSSTVAASGSQPSYYGPPGEQEDRDTTTSCAPAIPGGYVVVKACCGSSTDVPAVSDASGAVRHSTPLMRGRVNSVVAHKFSLDSTVRRSQLQDVRGSGGILPATPSLDSMCSSDIHTPVYSARGQKGASLHTCAQEREASPDSSVERLFAHTDSSASAMLHFHRREARSVTEEDSSVAHHHMRTGSEVSLPAAAATYNGGSALQQRLDERGCITVVDPQRRKLHVPLSAIQMTKALNGRLKTPSLCLLYQSSRCRQGENCYQVHVDPVTVERLRADAKDMPCCCFQHGDGNSHLIDLTANEGRSLDIAGQFSLPLTRTAYTAGLQRLLQNEQSCTLVNPSALCRLHGQPGGCRFGADCRFLHICFQILQNELASIMAGAVAASASSAVIATTAEQRQHHQQPSSAGGGAAVPGPPPTSRHSHTGTSVANLSNAMGPPVSASVPSTGLSQQIGAPGSMTLSVGDLAELHPMTLPSPPRPQQQHQYQLPQSRSGNRSPRSVDLVHNGFMVSTPRTVHRSANAAMLSLNNATTSVVTGADFSPPRALQGISASATAAPNAFTGCLPSSSQQQQQSPTPSLVHLQPRPCAGTLSTPSTSTYFTLTTLQPQGSPVQTPAGRHSPRQTSTSGSTSSACRTHRRTLSTPSNGTHPSRRNPSFTQTPNNSAAPSPMHTGSPMAHSWSTFSTTTAATVEGTGGAYPPPSAQLQFPRQRTPLQQHQPSFLPHQPQQLVHLYQPHQTPTSQQFYIQQMNADGSFSLVPVNIVQGFGGGDS